MKCLEISIFLGKRPTMMFIIFWDFLMDEQIFLSPQGKRSVIISNKVVYHLKSYNLSKLEVMSRISKIHGIIAQCPLLPRKWRFHQHYQYSPENRKPSISCSAPFNIKIEFPSNILWMIVIFGKKYVFFRNKYTILYYKITKMRIIN